MPRRWIGLAVLVGCALTACTNRQSAPTTTPPSTATHQAVTTPAPSTPAPSAGPLTTGPGIQPGEKPPVLPEGAKQHTRDGATSFAGYYLRALDWSIATNDPFLLRAISAASCSACRRQIIGLLKVQRSGTKLTGGRLTILNFELVRNTYSIKADYAFSVRLHENREESRTPLSAPSTVSVAHKSNSIIFVSWLSRGWQIVEFGAS